jgi:catechol 2,3-dioxygenase-like lactoylglutathione lyase family enzyme
VIGEFRIAYFTPAYEATVAFYRDGLELSVLSSWDRPGDDRGTIFAAAAGQIEVLALPEDRPAGEPVGPWDRRPPQGTTIVLEVDRVEERHRRALERGLPIAQGLTDQRWGHRSFCVREPNGLVLYLFSPV